MLDQLREIVKTLFSSEDYPCQRMKNSHGSCLMHEEERPLNRTEKAIGWVKRPFDGYDPNNMCVCCRAYWHSELAAQALERFEYIKALEAREKASAK